VIEKEPLGYQQKYLQHLEQLKQHNVIEYLAIFRLSLHGLKGLFKYKMTFWFMAYQMKMTNLPGLF